MALASFRIFFPVILAFLLVAVQPVGAQSSAGLVRSFQADVASHDDVVLSTRIFYFDTGSDTPRPLVISAHGWGGSKEDRSDHAAALARRGYTVITYDARGFGESGGTVGLDGPDEVKDVSALIDFAKGFGTRARLERIPPVATDADDDPLVGMTGISYGGAVQLLVAAADPRIDAVVPEITWSDLNEALAPNGVVNRGWIDLLFLYGMGASHGVDSASPDTGGLDQRLAQWYTQAYATGRLPDDAKLALAERSPLHVLDKVHADVLLVHGYRDTLFVPDQALMSYQALSGRTDADTHLMLHGAGHGFGTSATEREEVEHATNDFLDRHLRGETAVKRLPPILYWQPGEGRWNTIDAWPSMDTPRPFALHHESDTVTLHQAAAPTSHTQTPNFQEQSPVQTQDAPVPTSVLLVADIETPFVWVGNPVVNITVTPAVDDLTLFFSLMEGDRVIAGQVTPVRIEGRAGEDVALEVPIRAGFHRVADGHDLMVRLTTSDSSYLGGREAGEVIVHISGATLSFAPATNESLLGIPDARGATAAAAPGPATALVALAVIVVAASARRHHRP